MSVIPCSLIAFLLLSFFSIFSLIFAKIDPLQICMNPAHSHQCNNHLDSNFRCQCAASENYFVSFSPLPSCFDALPSVEFPTEQLLTFGIAFPVMGPFQNDPERVFLEDLELFTFIPRECVLIYRKGCSDDGTTYEFQIGILSSKCTKIRNIATGNNGKPLLKSLSPLMFINNRQFMVKNPLKIAYVRKISSSMEMQKADDHRWEKALGSK